ncbi:STAS domain-containing protein [Streptomyces mirabilis]|uniref:STAS domain-containing protein n=1 Tax=Streptomyces mirabilis TaxID=68239 RepID=UPI00364B8878
MQCRRQPGPARSGRTRYATAGALREQAERLVLSPGQDLVIDLSGLEYCDSTSITALLPCRQRAQAADADMTLAAVPANTLRILTVVGLDQVFTIQPAAVPRETHVIAASTRRRVHG